MPTMNMIQALNDAHKVVMRADEDVVVFGEDAGYFGGVFRVTEGLQREFGKQRAFDAPISEGGIVATAVGMAAYGIKPLIEKALGVQTFREDREHESEFMTISYWEDIPAMARFTGRDPTDIHHLDRDPEFLIELPKSVQIVRLLTSHGKTG